MKYENHLMHHELSGHPANCQYIKRTRHDWRGNPCYVLLRVCQCGKYEDQSYRASESSFEKEDGVEIHYMDECYYQILGDNIKQRTLKKVCLCPKKRSTHDGNICKQY